MAFGENCLISFFASKYTTSLVLSSHKKSINPDYIKINNRNKMKDDKNNFEIYIYCGRWPDRGKNKTEL